MIMTFVEVWGAESVGYTSNVCLGALHAGRGAGRCRMLHRDKHYIQCREVQEVQARLITFAHWHHNNTLMFVVSTPYWFCEHKFGVAATPKYVRSRVMHLCDCYKSSYRLRAMHP